MNNYLAGGLQTDSKITNPVLKGGVLENLMLNEDGSAFLGVFLPKMVGLMFVAGFIIFVFMIIFGAIGWITSGGEKASLESARGKISNAFIGLIILASTFAVFRLLETFFGINILTIDIGPLIIR